MPRFRPRFLAAVLLAVGLIATPIVYRSVVSTKYRNFRVVEPGKLYRSGQMTVAGLATKVKENGVRTVVCLRDTRDDGRTPPDASEAAWCASNGVRHVVLSPKVWDAPSGAEIPIESNLKEYLAILADPAAQPVLVHCFAGIHRTGGYVAIYRLEHNGWSAEEAIEEMQSMGTPRTTFDGEIAGYLRNYTPGQLLAPAAVAGAAVTR